jgi:hypothetical protein
MAVRKIITLPLTDDPAILADWLERRVGGKAETIALVEALHRHYSNRIEKEKRDAGRTKDTDPDYKPNARTYGYIRRQPSGDG